MQLTSPIIRSREARDDARIAELLTQAALPLDGLDDPRLHVWCARDARGLVGLVGLEDFGEAGLLRSAVVDPAARGEGLGGLLVRHVIDEARRRGMRELYLLTTTAADYFPRFGFSVIERADVAPAVHASPELSGACPDSAVVMRRVLDRE